MNKLKDFTATVLKGSASTWEVSLQNLLVSYDLKAKRCPKCTHFSAFQFAKQVCVRSSGNTLAFSLSNETSEAKKEKINKSKLENRQSSCRYCSTLPTGPRG